MLHWFRGLVYVEWVSLSIHSAFIQRQFQLDAIITPANATNQNLVWTSSNTSIATVDNNWLVTPTWEWTVTITVTLDWYTDSCELEVELIPVTWVSLNKNSIELWEQWETSQLVATVTPNDAYNKNIIWTSSNTSVATVDNNWLVTSVGEWNATITVTTEDWWFTDTCSVSCVYVQPVSQVFTYTWADQNYTIPYTQCYKLEAWWAWSYDAAWWYASWVTCLTKWTSLKIMVWQSGSTWWTYWFWWTSNYSTSYNWWWLSWIFTGSSAISASDNSRALVIWWWAGSCSGRWSWWAWGWLCWCNWWTGWYWTQGWWGTQTWHWSTWNQWSAQFCWWNGSWYYWAWWGWWWRWWNWTAWDSSAWDDNWAGWGSWYVKSWFTSCILTTWWWASSQNNWCVKISSI